MIITAATQVFLTLFDDYSARAKIEKVMTLGDLAEMIRRTNRNGATVDAAKAHLPWLKLAQLGNARTRKGSLRSDKNVLSFSGIELDYDEEKIDFDEAVERLIKANVGGLLYTSPSYTADCWRWRFLGPTSGYLAPAMRAALISRGNGVIGGGAAAESWKLSQAYFYGSANNNPLHRVEIIEGEPVDLLEDLDLIAIGPPKVSGKGRGGGARPAHPSTSSDGHRSSPRGPAAGDMLDVVSALMALDNPQKDWERWNYVAMATWAATSGSDAGYAAFLAWSEKIGEAVFDRAATEKMWQDITKSPPDGRIGAGTLFHLAREAWPGWERPSEAKRRRDNDPGEPPEHLVDTEIPTDDLTEGGVVSRLGSISLADFYAYLPRHSYLFIPTLELWPPGSVNARVPWIPIAGEDDDKKMPPSVWLDHNKPIEQMVWAPGQPMTIPGRVLSDGGWIEHEGVTCFNLYRPALLGKGDATKAGRWVAHVETVYPVEATHIIRWLAHRVQHPEDKVNHALVLGGEQGIGKDSLLEPVKRAVGAWNFAEPSPLQIMRSAFNGFGRSVILRISEARDLGDVDRYAFYEHLKIYCAAPPDVLRLNEKNLREYNILNCCGVVITTNHLTDGIYLPADDRRHFVTWSMLTKDDFDEDYWNELWRFYDAGGDRHVAAYLAGLDLKAFNPKAPPPKTEAFWTIVNAGRAPEDAELTTIFDLLGNPDAVTLRQLAATAAGTNSVDDDFADWLKDRKNRRTILYRLEACGYVPIRNPDAVEDKLWKVNGRRVAIYARATLSFSSQVTAARKLAATRSGSV